MKKQRLQELAGLNEYETQFQQAGAGISTNRDPKPGDRELQLNKAFLTDDGYESAVMATFKTEMDLFKTMDDAIESSFLPKVKM